MENYTYGIEIKQLEKKFGVTKVLDGIELKCKRGSITGIIGYNGCGKSVLFKCIAGLLIPDKGQIFVRGIEKRNTDIITNAGIIIEEPFFLPHKSGYQNLMLLYTINNKKNKDCIYQIMNKVGLNPRDKKKVAKYSLGMKQRLAIAQASMENQDILILDEPFNGLDKKGVEEMREFFLEMKLANKTILLASHNIMDIKILCDNVYEIENGKLIFSDF